MNLTTLILQVILTIPLTIILSHFERKERYELNGILIPSVYIIIISALLPSIKENIFLIVVFEIFIRNFYIINVIEKGHQVSNIMFIIESLASIALSLFTYNYFINQVDTVIPNPEDIKPFIWFLIIIYITSLYKIMNENKKNIKQDKIFEYKKEQNIIQYAKYKNIYSQYVKSKNNTINNLTYAIMIFNNYNVSKLQRQINDYIFKITKNEAKQGIMQLKSSTRITDSESILLSIKNMEGILKKTSSPSKVDLHILLKEYNEDDQSKIIKIYEDILDFQKK